MTAKLAAGSTLEVPIAQAAESTTAVALNVTVTEPNTPGFLTVFPCDQTRPTASNLNFVGGETVPNLVNVKVSVTRSVCIFTSTTSHLIVDSSATFERGGGAGATPVAPSRVLDTRIPIGVPSAVPIEAGAEVVLQFAGVGGVPSFGASAVTMNVTVTESDGPGFRDRLPMRHLASHCVRPIWSPISPATSPPRLSSCRLHRSPDDGVREMLGTTQS